MLVSSPKLPPGSVGKITESLIKGANEARRYEARQRRGSTGPFLSRCGEFQALIAYLDSNNCFQVFVYSSDRRYQHAEFRVGHEGRILAIGSGIVALPEFFKELARLTSEPPFSDDAPAGLQSGFLGLALLSVMSEMPDCGGGVQITVLTTSGCLDWQIVSKDVDPATLEPVGDYMYHRPDTLRA